MKRRLILLVVVIALIAGLDVYKRQRESTSRSRIRMERKCVTAICLKPFIWTSVRRHWNMNLMEITKGHEPKQNEQTDQTKNSLDTTDKWKQLAKEQAETLEKVSAERDELQVRNQKMNEFIQEFQERTHKLKMEKQQLFFENHEMQEEMQKSNAEIQQMTVEPVSYTHLDVYKRQV